MNNKKLVHLVLIIFLFTPQTAYCVSNELVRLFMDESRKHLSKGILDDGSYVPKETDEEKQSDIIPFNEARKVVQIGIESAYAEWCNTGIHETSYLEWMQQERKGEKWTSKQLAYIGILHGMTTSIIYTELEKSGQCPKEQAERIIDIIQSRNHQ